jgi:hypothetical protein
VYEICVVEYECGIKGGEGALAGTRVAIKPPAVEERITVALQMLHDPELQYRLFQELIADELGVWLRCTVRCY